MNNVLSKTSMFLILILIWNFILLSQEKKGVKLEVFEKEGKTLTFSAVDKDNNAIRDLEKKDIILLLNGRNFRDFSLVYPSKSKTPIGEAKFKHSNYDIIFPYAQELYTTMSIQIGTTRPQVHLHSWESLKINQPIELVDITGSISETTSLPSKNFKSKLIPIQIINVDNQGHQITSDKTGIDTNNISIPIEKKTQTVQLPVPLPDSKTVFLKKLKKIQLGMLDKANRNFCEATIQFLKQNRVKEALHFCAKITEQERISSDTEAFLLPFIEKLKHSNYKIEALLNNLKVLTKKRNSAVDVNTWDTVDSLIQKEKIKKALSHLQEVLENHKIPVNVIMESLEQLTVILEVQQFPPFKVEKNENLLSPAQQFEFCREKLHLFLNSIEQLESQVFITPGRTKQILTLLDQAMATGTGQLENIQSRLSSISDLRNPQHDTEVTDFVIKNSIQFPIKFKEPFFKKKLAELGVSEELQNQSSFFNILTHSYGIEKNSQGYWECLFNDEIVMVYIPAGEFSMGVPWESGGAEDESPQHTVKLDGSWISKYEITFEQYDWYCQETGKGKIHDYGRGRKNLPVIGVTWKDCLGFCLWLSMKNGIQFRLPTEAEWEKAARGTEAIEYPWGNAKPKGEITNFADISFLKKYLELNPPLNEADRKQKTDWIDPDINDGYVFTAPVGSYPQGASPYGVMDMAGNVWEWVMDWYDDDYYQRSPSHNPMGQSTGVYKIARGGGWDCHPWLLRSTGRAGCDPNLGNDALGFRVTCHSVKDKNRE